MMPSWPSHADITYVPAHADVPSISASRMHCINTVEEWNHHLGQAKESSKPVVVDFTASWCGPCRIIAPIFAELARKFANVIFLKVDVDELKTVSEEWKVTAMPTFIFLKNGEVVDKLVGAHKDELPKKVELLLNMQ